MNLHRHTFDHKDIYLYHAPLLDDEETATIIATTPFTHLFEGITSRSRLRERASEIAMLAEIAGEDGFEFSHTDIGSPLLTIGGRKQSVSISHSRTELAIAISDNPILGVDIENLRPQLLKVTSRFLNSSELDVWTRSPERLLQAWSAKEAAFKAWSPQVNAFSAITLTQKPDGSVVADAPFQHTLQIDFIMSQAPLRCIALARLLPEL